MFVFTISSRYKPSLDICFHQYHFQAKKWILSHDWHVNSKIKLLVVLAYNSWISWWLFCPFYELFVFTTSSRYTSSLGIWIHQYHPLAKNIYNLIIEILFQKQKWWKSQYVTLKHHDWLSVLLYGIFFFTTFSRFTSSLLSINVISRPKKCILIIDVLFQIKVDGSLSI